MLQRRDLQLPPVRSETTTVAAFLALDFTEPALYFTQPHFSQSRGGPRAEKKDSPVKFSPHLVAFKKRSLSDLNPCFYYRFVIGPSLRLSRRWNGRCKGIEWVMRWHVHAVHAARHFYSKALDQGGWGGEYLRPTYFDRKSLFHQA